MGDTTSSGQAKKKSFVQGLKAEYRKIIWPTKETVTKQTIAVLVSTVALGLSHHSAGSGYQTGSRFLIRIKRG